MDGRIFYTGERLGQHRKPFKIIKFRTMIKGADKYFPDLLIKYGIRNCCGFPEDERITRLGKILRKTHLDELPQFYNIWKGQMSLVGVRPRPSLEWDYYPKEHVSYVLTQKPGLCGIDYYYTNLRDSQDKINAHIEYTRQKEIDPISTDKKYLKGIIKNRINNIIIKPARDNLIALAQGII